MRVAVITCYKQPDYVRAQVLRAAVAANDANQLFVVKNSRLGLLRYPEVIWKTIRLRIREKPDVYIITFRGYEILPAINLITWPKRLIFDEFINPLEWLYEPRPEFWAKLVPKGLLRSFYRFLLKRPAYVLADTKPHAIFSAKTTYGKVNSKFVSLPVSTDETIFKPAIQKQSAGRDFKVFYYGNMLPLHGLQYVLEAAVGLKKLPVTFLIVGGKKDTANAVKRAVEQGANITYKPWVQYKKLPTEIYRADLCLGGPFGATKQASMVITGKTYQFLACAAPTLIGKNKATAAFTNKKDCLLVPLGDVAALTSTIRWAYQHPKDLVMIGKNGRKLYEKEFSIKAIAPQLELVLSMKRQNR